MELSQIKVNLDNPDFPARIQAVTQLQEYDPEIVVPLLRKCLDDREVIVRFFVAMELGKNPHPAAFKVLVELIESETDANVRTAAANSLAKYGQPAIPYLLELVEKDPHWLVERSLLSLFNLCPHSQNNNLSQQYSCYAEIISFCFQELDRVSVLTNELSDQLSCVQ